MRLSHTLQYYALISIAWVLNVLPRSMALGLGACVGQFAWFTGIRKPLVLSNIQQAFPDANDAELRRIGASSARNFGRTSTEFIRFASADRRKIHDLIKIEGLDTVLEALKAGNGAILLTGHFGSWAAYFAAISLEGVPLALLVGKQHNVRVDQFIHKLSCNEVEMITKGKPAIKKILQNIKQGRAVVMVADQNAGRMGIMTPFFGRETPTLALPSSFAIKHNIPVFTMTGHRKKDDSHQVVIKPLKTCPCENDAERKSEILRAYNEVLEDAVKQHPEQYFWYHRRWRDSDFRK